MLFRPHAFHNLRSSRIIALMLLSAFFCIPVSFARQKGKGDSKKVNLATLAPKGTAYHKALLKMKSDWKKCGVKLNIYTDGQMGGERTMLDSMRVNQLQAALMTASGLAEIDDSISALQNMPLMFENFEEVEYVRSKLRTMIDKKFEEKGFVILALEDTGWVKFFSTKAAATPDDFKKLKLFALASDSKAIQIWKSAGFNPISLDTTEMMTGLKTGMIEAIPSPPYYALITQSYRPAPNMLNLKWAPLVGGVVIKKDFWDKLPEKTQNKMRESAIDTGKLIRAAGRKNNVEAIKKMQENGLKIIDPTPNQMKEWRDAAEKAYPIIRGSIVPADLFDKVRKLLTEFRENKKKEADKNKEATEENDSKTKKEISTVKTKEENKAT